MRYESYIGAIRENTDLLVAAATAAGLDAPVPSCPGWTVRDLLDHVASEPYARIAARRTTEPPDFSWFNAAAPAGDPFENTRAFGYELADVLSDSPKTHRHGPSSVPVFRASGLAAARTRS